MEFLRSAWEFLTQPTEAISLFPITTKPIAIEGQALTKQFPISPSPSSSPPTPSLVRAELLGILSAIAIVQSIRWLLQRQQLRQEAERKQQAAIKRRQERIKFLVESLRLTKHPEGGFYRRIFESSWMLMKGDALRDQLSGAAAATRPKVQDAHSPLDPRSMHFPRHLHTSIYFLLTHEEPLSHLHRLPADEQWIHVEGDPLLISHIDPITNIYSERLLGQIDQQSSDEETQDILPAANTSTVETIFLEPCSTAPLVDVQQQLQDAESSSSSAIRSKRLPSLCYPTHVVSGGTWFGARWVERTTFVQRPATTASASLWQQVEKFLAGIFVSSATTCSAAGKSSGYSLVCCVVTPGFEFSDFALMGLQQFKQLKVEQQLRDRLQAAQIDSIEAQQSKIQRVREMVLHEETRGDAMTIEGNLHSKSK